MHESVDHSRDVGLTILNSILAVQVLYQRAFADTETYRTLTASADQFGAGLDLLIYDNSPLAQQEPATGGSLRVQYRHDPTNPGVSRAYNEGARLAREMGKQWLLLLDQDTTFPAAALATYCRDLVAQPDMPLLAPILHAGAVIVSPCRFMAGFGWSLKTAPSGRLALHGHSILNSGMLINLEAFMATGGFNEQIPLDFADHDFCRRFADRYRDVLLLPLACQHGFANREATTIAQDLHRFRYFCRGARQSMSGIISAGGYLATTLLRCSILCWRHRSLRFVSVLWREFFSCSTTK